MADSKDSSLYVAPSEASETLVANGRQSTLKKLGRSLTLALLLAAPLTAQAQDKEPPRIVPAQTALDKPGYLAFNESLLRALKVPAGFAVNVFAQPKGNTRIMAVAKDGGVYVSRQTEGDVLLLRDLDKDGKAEDIKTVASGLELVHGLYIYNDTLMYLIAPTKVWAAGINADGTLGEPKLLLDDLPDGGQHRARTIAVGPDNMLYMGVGSTCNSCDETNKENGTLLRANLDGSNRVIFAKGLRHTIGFAWNPTTQELWGMDMGADERGDNIPPEELNQIVQNADYGWPICYGNRLVDQKLNFAPKDKTREAYCAETAPPALTYTAHSAPIDFKFYTGTQFPADYQGDAFITLRGSWNRVPPSGYKVVRAQFENGKPVRIDDFLTGFLAAPQYTPGLKRTAGLTYQFARIAGVAVAADGALLVADDSNGVIYRVAYVGR